MTVIRPMTGEDLEAVLALWRVTEGVGLNESDSPANLAAYLQRNPGLSQVAAEDEHIVGAVLAGHEGRRGYLNHLAVAAEHRGRGLGRGLVAACLAALAQDGITRCNVFVYRHNAAGQAFWAHLGFGERAELVMMQGPTER